MNSLLASSIPLALVAVLVMPLLAAALSPRDAVLKWALGATFAFVAGVSLWQSGLLSPAVPSWVTTGATFSAPTDSEKCNQLLSLLRQYGVLTGPPRRGVLVVTRSIWDNLPAEAQQMAQACAGTDGAPADVTFAGAS